jgi:exonuclease III
MCRTGQWEWIIDQLRDSKIRTRANIRIATATMKREIIAILALQETHLDQEIMNNLYEVYKRRFEMYNSELPHAAPRSSAGVAFVINKNLIKPSNIVTITLTHGRALALTISWKGATTTLVNIYAPKEKRKPGIRERTWKRLSQARFPAGRLQPHRKTID